MSMKTPTHAGLCVANLAHHTLVELPDGLPSIEPSDPNYRRAVWVGHDKYHECLSSVTQHFTVYGGLLFYGDNLALFVRFDNPRALAPEDGLSVQVTAPAQSAY